MELAPLYAAGLVLVVTLLDVILLRAIGGSLLKGRSVTRDMSDGNAAQRLLHVGEIFGVLLVASSAVKNAAEGESLAHDLGWSVALGVLGLVLVLAFGRIGLALLLQARLPGEIERGNTAAGLAAGANFAATGIVASRAMAGSDLRGLALSLAFFAIAMATLYGFVSLFRAITSYDDAEQIQGENMAAAISYGGIVVAIAVIVARALEGNFVSWSVSMRGYVGVLATLVVFYPVRQLFVQMLLLGGGVALRGGLIDRAVTERNEGIAAVEAVSYLATAFAIARLA